MTDPTRTDILANVIREIDGNHDLGAAELAEKLIERGYDAYPHQNGDVTVLGPGTFMQGEIVSHEGVNFYTSPKLEAVAEKLPEITKDTKFEYGDAVDVLHRMRGEWLSGHVYEVSFGLINVNTEYGPVTVTASPKNIRRTAS